MLSKALADIARHITMLEIRCSRCDRSGRMSVVKLIDQYGVRTLLPRAFVERFGIGVAALGPVKRCQVVDADAG
jgi:hypothetical protein